MAMTNAERQAKHRERRMTAAQELRIALLALVTAVEADADPTSELEAAHLALQQSEPTFGAGWMNPDARRSKFQGLVADGL